MVCNADFYSSLSKFFQYFKMYFIQQSLSDLEKINLRLIIFAFHLVFILKQLFLMMNKKYADSLGLPIEQLTQLGKVRKAYKKQMANVLRSKAERIKLNQAYSQVCAKIFKSSLSKLELVIISGELQVLKQMFYKNKNLLNEKVNQYPIIYLAVRSGHYEIVEYLLKAGCCLSFSDCISTPMHCAAYYGHYNLIPLLLMYGVPIDIKNKHGHLPIEEAANPQIEKLLTIVKESRIQALHQTLLKIEVGHSIINILVNKQVMIKKIISKSYFQFYSHGGYDNAFHGTHYENLTSIMKYGLRKPGQIIQGKQVDIVKGHIPLGTEFQGKKNWSKAIFTSPSIYYAAHPVYSKEFIENNDKTAWLPLVQVKVRKEKYTRHDHTLKFYDKKVEEPVSLEFRVECSDPQENLIMRSQSSENVIVVAALFIRKGFLEENDNYEGVTKLILDSKEERAFRALNC